jgi:hypothetical protein
MTFKHFLLAAVALATTTTANAAVFNLNYRLADGQTIAAQLEGELLSDGDTVAINSVIGFPSYNGASISTGLADVFSASYVFSEGAADPQAFLTLNGSGQADLWMSNGFAGDSTAFIVVPGQGFDPTPAVNTRGAFGQTAEYFVSANYSLTAANTGAVPEPASWALMIGGFGLIGASARRRRMTAVAA